MAAPGRSALDTMAAQTKSKQELDPTATDERADAPAGGSEKAAPFKDPLAAMFGVQAADEEDEDADDNTDDADEDEESSADAEADADDDEASDGDADEDDDGTEEEDSDGEEDDDDDADEEEDDSAEDADTKAKTAKEAKWKAEFDKLPKEAQRIVAGQREAIDKLRKQRNALKEEVALLKPKAEAAEQSPRTAVATPEDPLSTITRLDVVEDAEQWATAREEWCEDGLAEIREGNTVVEKLEGGKTREWTKEELKAEKARVRNIKQAVPARRDWIKTYQESNTNARKAYPRLFTKDSAEAKAAEEFIGKRPWLTRVPDAELIVGDALIGAAVREGKYVIVKPGKKPEPKEAGGKSKEKKTPPSAISTASGSAPAAKPKKTGNGSGVVASAKDMRAGKVDPLSFMVSASAASRKTRPA